MKKIKTSALIGLGALGILFGPQNARRAGHRR